MISLKLPKIRKQHLNRTKMLLLIFCLYHITQPAVCSWHVQLLQFKQKQQRNKKKKKKQAFHPSIRDRHVIYNHSNVTRREENVRRIYGSDVVSNS